MARFAWAIFFTAISVFTLTKFLQIPLTPAMETWGVFALYAVVAFTLSIVFRSTFARLKILLGLGIIIFGIEIALIIPRPREFLDFNSLRFLAGCFGTVTGSAWARFATYVMAQRVT